MLPYQVIFFDLGKTLVAADPSKWTPGARALLVALRSRGVRLGLISNCGDRTRSQLKQLLPLDFDWELFESGLILLSSEVGVEKPARGIYVKALSAAHAASTCLYCSEDATETLAAQRTGMHAARVDAAAGELKGFIEMLEELALVP